MTIRIDSILYAPPIGGERRMNKVATATTAATFSLFNRAISITSSTDATPIVLTLPAGHGFQNGDSVTVAGHTTNIGANGTWIVSSAAVTTITLTGSIGSGAGAGGATGTVSFSDPLFMVPKTKVWLAFEALTNDCYVRIGGAAAAGTTADNGVLIKAGATPGIGSWSTQRFYINPRVDTNIDILSTTGAGVLKWYICAPPGERDRQ